jgi:hypothetical protein
MGSAARHSTGRKAARLHTLKSNHPRARKGKRSTSRLKPSRPGIVAILSQFSDSLSIISTATKALIHAQEGTGTLVPKDAGEEIITLEYGVQRLRSAFELLDAAMRESVRALARVRASRG